MKSKTRFFKPLILSMLFGILMGSAPLIYADNSENTLEQEQIIDQAQTEPIQLDMLEQEEPQDSHNDQEQNLNALMAQATQAQQAELVAQEILKQLDMLAEITSDVAQILNNNQVRLTPAEKSAAKKELTSLGTMIGKIRYSAFLLAQKENFPSLVTLINTVHENLTTAIKTGLKTFPHTEYDLNTRANPTNDVDLGQLEESLTGNTDRITALSKKAPTVGLSTFNIMYRKLKKLNNDYKILRRVGTAALIGVGIGWIIYKLEPEYFFTKKIDEDKSVLKSNIQENPTDPVLNILASEAKLGEKYKAKAIIYNQYKPNNTKTVLSTKYSKEQWDETRSIKRFIGSPIPSDMLGGWDHMDSRAKGIYTRIEKIIGSAGLSFVSFACPGFALFDHIAPYIKDWAKYYSNLFNGNINQIDDYLAGGPIKKAGLISQYEKEVSVTLDDVIGNDHAKQEMLRIVAYVTNNEFFDRPGIVPPTGILLEGPTRTGKSFMAEATAGTIKQIDKEMGKKDTLHYVEIKAAELVEVGITQFFDEAQNYAPLIIFIDELDTIGLHRLRDSKRFGEMLTAMSTLNRKNKNKVIIIAATNKPEQLDDSLRASGRFGKHLHFVYPTLDERKVFLQKELEKRAIFIEEELIDKLAQESEGYPFDALSEMLRTALIDGKIQGKLPRAEDFERAFDEDINLILSDKSPLPLAEQELVSIHQSGHAMARILLDANLQLTKVTTRPTGVRIPEEDLLFNGWKDKEEKDEEQRKARTTVVYGSTFTMHKPHTLKFDSHQDLLDELTICLAGHAAEKLLYGNTSYSYHAEDNDEAMSIAKRLVFEGMREKDASKELKERKLTEAHALISKYKEIAYNLLAEHKEELAFVALVLLKEELLSAEQIMHIMNFVVTEKAKGNKPEEVQSSDADQAIAAA
jgi:cell division protease FtsH